MNTDPNGTNAYEQRQAERKARYEELAHKASTESADTYDRARKMASVIPFGQPIHVGHHSERSDRNYRDRIHDTYGKAFALHDKAAYYEQKAEGVGTGGISSDDPQAIVKLRAELDSLEQLIQRMKTVNKVIRLGAHATEEWRIEALMANGFTEAQAIEELKPNFEGHVGYYDFTLRNKNANARRIKLRIQYLEKLRQRPDVERQGPGYIYKEDIAENRVMFIFDGKPGDDIRQVLKHHAFKWSPSRGAWVRQLNNAGIWAAGRIKETLNTSLPVDNPEPQSSKETP